MNCYLRKITISNVKNHKLKIQRWCRHARCEDEFSTSTTDWRGPRAADKREGSERRGALEGHYQSAAREATRDNQEVFLEVRKLGDRTRHSFKGGPTNMAPNPKNTDFKVVVLGEGRTLRESEGAGWVTVAWG